VARQRYDIGSKWLLQNYGKSALRVGGLTNVLRTEPMPGEVVQNRRFPDGLLQAFLRGESSPHHVLIEIATYPERRALKQALDDLTLAYSALGHLPDLLMLVLRPKGTFRIDGRHTVAGKLGLSELHVSWRTVEMWTLSAELFLAEGDVGVLPWVPLMQMARPPADVLQACATRIKNEAPDDQETDMLAISELMTELRFPDLRLLDLFGGKRFMIESPMLKKWLAENLHEAIEEALRARFKSVPRDLLAELHKIVNERRLKKLTGIAAKCADLDAFRNELEK
jgi:hypothetical protein